MPVIFDMDGVLVDGAVHWKQVGEEFLAGLVPHWDRSLQQSIWGMSLYAVHEHLVAHHGVTLSVEEFLARYQNLARIIYGERASLIPGTARVLRELRRHGIRRALCSSSPHAWLDIVLERFSLREDFDVVVSAQDVGGRSKPAPDVYCAALEALKTPADHCVAIEDSAKGILSAKAAGMFCAAIRNGFNDAQDLSGADLLLSTPDELSLEKLMQICPTL